MPKADKEAKKRAEGEAAVLEAIAAMDEADRSVGEKLHQIITENAPALVPKTWYGMPAYAKDDRVVCFFRDRKKFKERFMTLGFNESANLDEGNMWPIYYALMKLEPEEEQRIAALVKKAAG